MIRCRLNIRVILPITTTLFVIFADEFKKFKCHQLIRNSLRSSCQELKSLGIGLNCTGYVPNARKNLYNKFIFIGPRSEEHTSELQSRFDIVCRLLLDKKND